MSPSRIVCRRQDGPTARKDTFRPDFQWPILDLCFLIKAKVIKKERKKVVWKIGNVSLGQFGANEGLTK
jgi:hypothetical protein